MAKLAWPHKIRFPGVFLWLNTAQPFVVLPISLHHTTYNKYDGNIRHKLINLLCIFRYLHLQDNMDPAVDKSDKLWKLRGFMDLLLAKFQDLYEVNGFVTVDESMVKFKGRLAFRQYLPMKPVKWGVKVWVMAESKTGYVNHFQVYTGAIQGKAEKDLAHRIVMDLAKPYFGSNLTIYMDNFYTGVPLMVDLKNRGVQACGTVRANRKGLPKSKDLTKQAGMNRHQYKVDGAWMTCSRMT